MAKVQKTVTLAGFALAGLTAGAMLMSGMPTAAASDDRSATDRVAPRCLDGRNIGRKHVVNPTTLLVYDDFGNPYKLDVGGPCRTMDDNSRIGFEFNGSDQICGAHDATILFSHWDEPPLRCVINGVERLTKAQALEIDPD